MLLTASRSRREGAGARASLEAALGNRGGSGRGRRLGATETAGQGCGDHRRRVERRRALGASRNLVRMVLGFRGGGASGGSVTLRGVTAQRAGLRSGSWRRAQRRSAAGFARRWRRDRRFGGVGSCSGRVFRGIVRRGAASGAALEGRRLREVLDLAVLRHRRDLRPARRPPVAKARRVRRSTRPSGRRD